MSQKEKITHHHHQPENVTAQPDPITLPSPTEHHTDRHTTPKNEFDFSDLTTIEIPVTLPSFLGGNRYILREADGEAHERYLHFMMENSVREGDDMRLTQPRTADFVLLSGCLCEVDNEGNLKTDSLGNPVHPTIGVIKKWPNRIIKPLVEKAEQISEINLKRVNKSKDEDTLKNG